MNVGSGMASISGYGGPSGASNFYFMARNVGMMGKDVSFFGCESNYK
jgi:hypothetical protein